MNKYSFSDLLGQNIVIDENSGREIQFDKIEIPMIQRDYAQGRDTEKDVRKRFLDAIFNAITGGEILEMDFVYGSVYESKNEKDGKCIIVRNFIPLDGQQRLTTLFLMYWYIGARELRGEKLTETMVYLNKFSYSTRTSSRKFCENITEKYTAIVPRLADYSPREIISNFSWFYSAYEKDPTVKAMLNMLEEIHTRYSEMGCSGLFDGLDNLKFYVLPLDGFNLTEELYVKMNARGKSLTDFENFKADFIKWMKSNKNDEKEQFKKEVEIDDRRMPYFMAISQKIDNVWTNIFWQEIKKLPEEELKPYGYVVDPYYMRFFNRYLCNLVIQNSDNAETVENDNTFRYFYGNNGDDQNITFRSFERYEKLLSLDVVERIEIILDGLSGNMDILRLYINPAWEEQKNWNMFDKSITQRQRIAFYATTLYIENNDVFEEDAYANWMRFVWNLIVDSTIRSIPAMIRAMKQIKEFSVWSGDILSRLSVINECEVIESKMDEEATKARLIRKGQGVWVDVIKRAESHSLFKGEIRFLLPCADNTTVKDFSLALNAAERIFANNTFEDNDRNNYLWIRATLAKNEEFQFPTEITLLNGRFDNWKTLINYQLITGIRNIINCINAEPNKPTTEILKNICDNYQYDDEHPWVYPIVTWEGKNGEILIEYSESKKIQNYNYYENWYEQTYLYNKNRWTDGNIMLSSFRNQICEALVNRFRLTHNREWGNIQNRFFRGSTITFSKSINGNDVYFIFDTQYLRIGIQASDNNDDIIDQSIIDEKYREEGWLYRVKYNYMEDVVSLSDIQPFADTIEDQIFNEDNPQSLTTLLLKR
jgi:hypothetical protein